MRVWLAAMAFSVTGCMAMGQSMPRVEVVDGVIYVSGLLPAEEPRVDVKAQKLISIFTHEAFVNHLDQPVAGTYSWAAGRISFKPMYPFSAGSTYHAVFSTDALSDAEQHVNIVGTYSTREVSFTIPEEKVPATSVTVIYPVSDVLPENLLRMHFCFSAPMMPGEAYSHIVVVNAHGERVDKAFLVVDQELWDATRTRLTVLFDPGRIKRGLKANLELGPPLKAGGEYSLKIDSTWRDVHGRHLQQNVVKTFRVNAPQRNKLSVEELKVSAPSANSRTPLVIRFERPMDRALMTKYITVQDASSNMITGSLEVAHDSVLTFSPDRPWSTGKYSVLISPLLEDVSGNNFENAFDVDLMEHSRAKIEGPIVLSFSVGEMAH